MANESKILYTTIQKEAVAEFEEKRSLFIGHAKPVKTEEEAAEFIKAKKREFADATHNVFGYVIKNGVCARYSDDGEPQGTAGMPVLDALRKNGITDAVIVVVRYFGGILLGTGGLVHAYGEAALGALKASKPIIYNTYAYAMITVSYSDYQRIGGALAECEFASDDVDYTDVVSVMGSVIDENYDILCEKLSELTSGRAEIKFIEKKYSYRE